MGYAILRTQKLKDKGSIRRSLKHSFRAQDTPNADPERTPDNSHIGAGSVDEAMDKISDRLNTQEKIRKNAVLAVEYLITGSPESLNDKNREDQDKYFDDALDWLKERHGQENVIYAGIHRDETTPHLYVYVTPIDERGKLNCRAFLGGSKALNQMQTDFAEKVGKKHDLERGIEGSKAKHKSIRQYYTEIQQTTIELTVPSLEKENTFFSKETDDSFKTRIAYDMAIQAKPAIEKAKRYDAAKQETQQYKKTAEKLEGEAKQYRELMQGLTPEQQAEVKQLAEQHKQLHEKVLQGADKFLKYFEKKQEQIQQKTKEQERTHRQHPREKDDGLEL